MPKEKIQMKRYSNLTPKSNKQPGTSSDLYGQPAINDTAKHEREEHVGSDGRPDPWYNPHKDLTYRVAIYEHETCLRKPAIPDPDHRTPPRRKKKDINRFSKKSRFRLIRLFNRLRVSELSNPLFVTLTARHESVSAEEFRDLARTKFLRNIEALVPDMRYLWRLEEHKDGYPHFHIFIWSGKRDYKLNTKRRKTRIRQEWLRLIDDDSWAAHLHACKIEPVTTYKRTISYVAKYTAKVNDDQVESLNGRRWGASRNLPMDEILEVPISRRAWQAFQQESIKRMIARGIPKDKAEQLAKKGTETFVFMSARESRDWFFDHGETRLAQAIDKYLAQHPPPGI